MYKLPDDISETFLKNDIVNMFCFNINQIYIYFESSVHIIIEGQYIISQNNVDRLHEVYPVCKDNDLLLLLEKRVKKINISKSRQDLSLQFDDDISLKLLGSSEYESYIIKTKDRRIVV